MAFALSISGCVGMADGIAPVKGFEVDRYLGKWYEIARLDHSFEEGLDQVTAEYSLREDGGVDVRNRGFSSESNSWEEAQGKAYFVGERDVGHLKVSFFGPFYGSYVIFELEQPGYEHAFIASYNKSYLWLLARKPDVDPSVITQFLATAKLHGFETDRLIFVNHK
ncbi:MAG: lipocalin family protein [Gammaproteobacteria bacterium]|nr:lipocalin family protein [Gammaproteobacteria bacterium]